MVEVITNLFDVHKRFIGRFSKYDVDIIIFLKRVVDNFASHLSPMYNLPIDDELVEQFKERYPAISLEDIDREVSYIKRIVRRFFENNEHIKSSYFEVRCEDGNIVLEFQTFEDVIPSRPTINYNVPWGSPPNTIRGTHMDTFAIPFFNYLWVEDDSAETEDNHPCDIVVGDRLFALTPGLYKWDNGELIEQNLSEVKDVNRVVRSTSGSMSGGTTPQCSSLGLTAGIAPLYLVNPSTTRYGKLEGVLELRSSGNYGPDHFEYLVVDITNDQIEKGDEYDVIINGISFGFNKPGLYRFVDGEFVAVE